MNWTAQILTIFPDMFPGPLGASLAGQALEREIWSLEVLDIRDFARNKHRAVDDTPAGGGPGMVMRVDVLAAAVDAARAGAVADWPLVCPGPRGRRFDQAMAQDWAARGGVTIICGRFEGVDERLFAARGVEEVSIGDFVLSGGEPAAIAMLDAAIRLLPGVVGDPDTLTEESFERGLLEYPQYTRPRTFEGLEIPEVLQSGHHGRIAEWRRLRAEEITRERRPDLWSAYVQTRRKGESHECD